MLFTDVSRFTLFFSDGRIRVWRHPGVRFHDAAVREHDCYDGGSVMVSGGFVMHHRTPLHHVREIVAGTGYRDVILQPVALPALQATGQGAHLQHATSSADSRCCH